VIDGKRRKEIIGIVTSLLFSLKRQQNISIKERLSSSRPYKEDRLFKSLNHDLIYRTYCIKRRHEKEGNDGPVSFKGKSFAKCFLSELLK
jgi:hypothetical protein